MMVTSVSNIAVCCFELHVPLREPMLEGVDYATVSILVCNLGHSETSASLLRAGAGFSGGIDCQRTLLNAT